MSAAPRVRVVLGLAAGALLLVGTVAAAALPTGAATLDGVVPSGDRIAARAVVGPARVLLVSDAGRLRLAVAYRGPKGWLAVPLDPPPADTVAAWSSTRGGRGIPALAAVYGRAGAAGARTVRIEWADGQIGAVPVAPDGTWLGARLGRVRVRSIRLLAGDGSPLAEVPAP